LKVRWHNPGTKPRNASFVSITKGQGFSFSSHFMRENKLLGHNFVRFGTDDEDDYVIICEFSEANTSPSPEWLQLQRKFRRGKARGETAQTKASAFISDNHILSQLVKQPRGSKEDSRFHIEFNIREKVFVIQLIPSFERLVTLDELKDDDAGIYRLISNGEVVYIGKGMIKQRIRQHKADKDFDKIEVSFVPQEEKQLEYESFHIDRYKNRYGRLPVYNKIAGHTKGTATSR
jgi:hypothetical protein